MDNVIDGHISAEDAEEIKATVRQRLWHSFEEMAEWNPLWCALQVRVPRCSCKG